MPKTKNPNAQPAFRNIPGTGGSATETGHPIDGRDELTQAEKDAVFAAKVRDPVTGSPNNGRGVMGGGS